MQTPPVPPEQFYYLIAGLLGAFILWGIGYYIVSTHGYMKQMTKIVNDLGKMLAVHEEKHEQHERELEILRGNNGGKRKFQ